MAGRIHPKALPPVMGAATPVGGGKNAKQVQMGSPHAGVMNPPTKGDPLARMTNHYKKGAVSPSLGMFHGASGRTMQKSPGKGGLMTQAPGELQASQPMPNMAGDGYASSGE
jgi:hypothetical protein